MDNLPCFQLNNKKHVEGDKAEGSNRKEVTRKEGIPVRRKELFPGAVRFQVTGPAKTVKDSGNSFVGNG